MSQPTKEFAVAGTRVVTPEGVRAACIVIRNGTIAGVVQKETLPPSIQVEDVGNLVVMPGLVDSHVHINEPGRTEWEGFETATRSAASGGITTLVDMPLNSSPVTTTVDALKKKLEAREGKLWVDCGFYGGVIPGNANELQRLADAGVLGFKAFLIHSGIDEFPNATEADLRAAMPIIAKNNLPLLVHCELQSTIARSRSSNPRSYQAYLASRPTTWEHDAISMVLRLSREFGCRTHIVHLSSANEVPLLQKAKNDGLPVTVESCPHYLYFSAEEIADGDTRFKCAPPIRENENRERLWQAIRDGVIDMIVSDHSPSTPALKLLEEGDFQKAWGGIASLQFGLSIVWTEARKRGFTPDNVASWMCTNPSTLVGLGATKGSIVPGCDADLVVWNPENEFTVDASTIRHRHKVTPYEGRRLFGTVERTYLRGKKIFDNGTFPGSPSGMPLLRNSAHQERTRN